MSEPHESPEARAWADRYARQHGVTVEYLLAIGREVRVCDCGEAGCQGWRMAQVRAVAKLPPPLPGDPRGQLKERIMPGLWVDMANGIHWSIPEVLAHLGFPDDAEHRAMAKAVLFEMMREHSPKTKIIESE